jgi:hypothetical protein
MDTLPSAIAEFAAILDRASAELPPLTDAPRVDGQWSRKQILGHLIDSAANNHQRFVRGQLTRDLATPGYAQEEWVATQRYEDREWADLVAFWLAYNRHLLHLMKHAGKEHLDATIRIAAYEPATLEYVMIDYVRHLKHHLAQTGLRIE